MASVKRKTGKAKAGKAKAGKAKKAKPKKAKAKKAKPKKVAAKAKTKTKAKAKTKTKTRTKTKVQVKVKVKVKVKAKAKVQVKTAGRFIWHDLMTTDAAKALPFYTALFGWELDEVSFGGFAVHLIRVGDRRVGTIMQESGIPSSHWMPYIAVDDADKACARVQALGGNVCLSAGDVPMFGRFGVVNDPQGALFSPLARAAGADTSDVPMGPGVFCWDELHTSQPDAAAEFYARLLGWTIDKLPMDGMTYYLARQGERQIAGLMQSMPGSTAPPNWLTYIAVENVDASADRAGTLGGRVLSPPMDIPNIGRFAVVGDPTGATFALFRGTASA